MKSCGFASVSVLTVLPSVRCAIGMALWYTSVSGLRLHCSLQENAEEKVLARIACSKLMQKKIARWRQEHDDWEALAAFALSKNTGRRFKNKPHGESSPVPDLTTFEGNGNANPPTGTLDKNSLHFSNSVQVCEMSDSESVASDNNSQRKSSSDKPCPDKLPKTKHVQNASPLKQQIPVGDRSQKQVSDSTSRSSVSRHDVIVRRISLDELSDEELFLPPPDEDTVECVSGAVPFTRAAIANGFFVVSGDEASSDDESPTSEAFARTEASSLDADDDDDTTNAHTLRGCVKSSTMFAGSLSHQKRRNTASKSVGKGNRKQSSDRQNQRNDNKRFDHSVGRNRGKEFSRKQFTKSTGNSLNTHAGRYPRKSEERSHGNAKAHTK